MAQPRQFQMEGGGGGGGGSPASYIDTTLTKIFVGGLAWETQRDTMRRYFEQFGEIIEAVVITDKNTGRSKGYGFVTFKDPESAMRACQNPSPIIDGRRANCNLACLGAQKTRPPTPRHGTGRFRTAGPGLVTPPTFRGSSSAFIHQPAAQFTFPYTGYGFAGYSQESMYPLNYLYGGQQFSPYFNPSGSAGMLHSFYPYYSQYGAQSSSSQTHHFGLPYTPQPVVQYPYLTQQFSSQPLPPVLSLPTSFALAAAASSSSISVAAAVQTSSTAPATTTATAASTTSTTTTTTATAATAAAATAASTTTATTKAVPVMGSGQKQST